MKFSKHIDEESYIIDNVKLRMLKRNKLCYFLISLNFGLFSMTDLAIQYFFKDELKLQPAEMGFINTISNIPWVIKPLFGLLSDLFPILGYRRKYYTIICGLIGFISWIIFSLFVTKLFYTIIILFIINSSMSFLSVLGEAIIVELSQDSKDDKGSEQNEAKNNVSNFFLIRYIGAILASLFKGILVKHFKLRTVFLIASLIPWLSIISGIIYIEDKFEKSIEEKDNKNIDKPNHCSKLIRFINEKYIIIPTLFIILFMASPSYDDSMFYFFTNELKLDSISLGYISLASTIAVALAIILYKIYFKAWTFRKIIILGTIISFIFSFSAYILVTRNNIKIGIPDMPFILTSSSLLSMLGELVTMPILSLACILSPKDLEGTAYSVFMSAFNLGGGLSNLLGSIFTNILGITSTDYSNLKYLILISNISTLIPLFALIFINNKYLSPEKRDSRIIEFQEIKFQNNKEDHIY